ncbi:unnamed protein product [Urochloa decumbens]|uniref:HhH-GPD domain-containing protein n=1 Tax=Urochloa decumbens TaxID=240449 RepID=A0ABC9H4D3_9POAL
MSAPAPAPAVMAEELEAPRQERWRKKRMEQAVVAAASSESPQPPATPDSKVEFPAPVTPETLTPTAVPAGKGRKRKKQEVPPASVLVWEAVPPTPATAAASAQILQVAAEGVAVRKVRKRDKLEQGHSGQPPSPADVHPQGGKTSTDGTDGGVGGSKRVRKRSSGKARVLTKGELLRMKFQAAKDKPLPEGFLPFMENPSYMDQGYCLPCDAFFEQFCYKPEPRKQPPSASGPQEEVNVKEKKMPEKKMSGEKPEKKSQVLSAAEKRSDVYRHVPLDQLVPAPCSPYKLLQEKYAHDPWKVMIICMFLNCTQGVQAKKVLEGFFKRYPDAQTASTADLEKMAGYLAPLGFQNLKAKRIQRFSKGYVEGEWTYVTELYGVGKYAADAYAIFCAGRATEVVPKDHKLVKYWNYVRNLPAEEKRRLQERQGNFALKAQGIAVSS